MVDWKLYIDAPQKRALYACEGSLDEGRGYGYGYGYGNGNGTGVGYGFGDGYGYGNGDGSYDYLNGGEREGNVRDGRSSNKW